MSQYEVIHVRPRTPEEAAQSAWFAEQRRASVDTLDNAAKLIVGLISGMLTLLFGVLALSNEPSKLPVYLTLAWLRWPAGAALLLQLGSLGAGLAVMLPRRWAVNPNQPSSETAVFESMLRTKSRWLTACIWAFGLGMLVLGLVLLVVVLTLPATP